MAPKRTIGSEKPGEDYKSPPGETVKEHPVIGSITMGNKKVTVRVARGALWWRHACLLGGEKDELLLSDLMSEDHLEKMIGWAVVRMMKWGVENAKNTIPSEWPLPAGLPEDVEVKPSGRPGYPPDIIQRNEIGLMSGAYCAYCARLYRYPSGLAQHYILKHGWRRVDGNIYPPAAVMGEGGAA
jgi:hypothetical protein